ncbi:hypothetical protein QWI17_19560, partial [Gilvimarinus sp. SDUM040013]|nr:hypothetical protein [Gilvimarinus sp. SDUM040013]
NEISDLDERLDSAATMISTTGASELPPVVRFESRTLGNDSAETEHSDKLLCNGALAGVRIAIAKDEAFSFIYPANLSLLRDLGAQLVFFSPLNDRILPDVDTVYLPGGYPELF